MKRREKLQKKCQVRTLFKMIRREATRVRGAHNWASKLETTFIGHWPRKLREFMVSPEFIEYAREKKRLKGESDAT